MYRKIHGFGKRVIYMETPGDKFQGVQRKSPKHLFYNSVRHSWILGAVVHVLLKMIWGQRLEDVIQRGLKNRPSD